MFDDDGNDENDPITDPLDGAEEPEIDLTDPFDGLGAEDDWLYLDEVEGLNETKAAEIEDQAESQDKFSCNHDNSERSVVVLPQSAGANAMGIGLQSGGGVPHHVCEVCGESHRLEFDENQGRGFGPMF